MQRKDIYQYNVAVIEQARTDNAVSSFRDVAYTLDKVREMRPHCSNGDYVVAFADWAAGQGDEGIMLPFGLTDILGKLAREDGTGDMLLDWTYAQGKIARDIASRLR